MAPLIRVIGSLTVDHVSITSRFPGPGETVNASEFFTSPGGKGANQAVACGRLVRENPSSKSTGSAVTGECVRVELVGAVGALDENFDKVLKPEFDKSGVDTSRIRVVPDANTGATMIIVDSSANGENRILFSGRANYQGMQPTSEVIGMALAAPMPDIIVMQGEIPAETVIGILRQVAVLKMKHRGDGETSVKVPDVILNPAPVPVGGFPDDVWAGVDHLIMNETEAELMMPRPKQLAKLILNADELSDKDKAARYFHKLGVSHVIITLGAKGSWYSTTAAEGDRVTNDISASKAAKVIDTTAAGDTFVGGYAVQMARWKEASQAAGKMEDYQRLMDSIMQFAAKAAAKCVEKPGAMMSLPWGNEI